MEIRFSTDRLRTTDNNPEKYEYIKHNLEVQKLRSNPRLDNKNINE